MIGGAVLQLEEQLIGFSAALGVGDCLILFICKLSRGGLDQQGEERLNLIAGNGPEYILSA